MVLPAAASAGATQTVFTVSIDADGTIYPNGARIAAPDRLRAIATRAIADHPDLRTVVQADGRSRHARVMHVIHELRLAGIARIAFAADRVNDGPASPAAGQPNASQGTSGPGGLTVRRSFGRAGGESSTRAGDHPGGPPSCCMSSALSSTPHLSASLPSAIRRMSITVKWICLPVAAIPWNSPA